MSEPYRLTASQALRAIRRRKLSVVELTESLLARIAAVEPRVEAWECLDREGALVAARAADAGFAQRQPLPLFGVPIGVKDIYDTHDQVTACGFPLWRERRPTEDATTVARVRQAGAILLGKTVTTQFAFADPPRTRNPWAADRTPGGSSSGSAAAVAAGMVPLTLGSQTAGSILRPAAYCGVCGFKPTFGLVSRAGIYPLAWSLDHPGPLARSVEDLALALAVLAGPDPRDPTTTGAPVLEGLAPLGVPTTAPRLGLLEDFFDAATPEVQETVGAAVAALERAGATVARRRLSQDLITIAAAQQTIMQVEAGEVHAALHAAHADSYAPRMRALIEIGQLIPGTLYLRAQRLRRQFRQQATAMLDGLDALVVPTVSDLAPARETTGDRTFQAPWSLVGFPAVTIPAGLSRGLPCGLQLVGRPLDDVAVLAAARWSEAVLPPGPAPPLG
jgi:aspartyl-tRNA(Asn)/glutamyl-tRNA(Gln) amidotransferase subunit A